MPFHAARTEETRVPGTTKKSQVWGDLIGVFCVYFGELRGNLPGGFNFFLFSPRNLGKMNPF